MNKGLARVIARNIAQRAIEKRVNDLEANQIVKVRDELVGLSAEDVVQVGMLVDGYIKTAKVEVYLNDWRVMDDGFVRPDEKEQYLAAEFADVHPDQPIVGSHP